MDGHASHRAAARRRGGWTLVELLIVLGIVLVIGTIVAMQINDYYAVTWTGNYAVAPPTIRNGQTATYLYKVTGKSQAKGTFPGSGRPVQFILAIPGPNEGVIQSYADSSGPHSNVNKLSVSATTAGDGTATVTVKVDSAPGHQFILNVIDSGPGCTGQACADYASITVIPP